MSTRINQNVLALSAQRSIWKSQKDLDQAINRLSSGLRINNSWDDPAALNISERFRANIASIDEAERNASYAINVIQMADGAMRVIDDQLIRMRALAVQASNGPLSSQDRLALDLEFDQLRSEITRIAHATNYNGLYLLDGQLSAQSPQGLKFHIGVMNEANVDYYFVDMLDVTATALGLDDLSLTTTATAQSAIGAIDNAIDTKDMARARLGSYVNRLQNTIENHQATKESSVASESMLRDADIAAEMSNFVRAQILMQSGISMLTQANMVPQMVAQLIG